ncbi:integrator complex assembly factor BRAT1 [Diretmus argenteus]
MDRECVALLPRVCEVLAGSGKSLPDDTSLEKLLDWFTGLSETGGSLLEVCPCLLEFISTVIYNTASDPGVLSFTLRLTGLLAATEDSFMILQERSILRLVYDIQHWQEAGLWEDPCIRIGWIQGLRSMLQHPMALHFLVETDLTKPLLQLQTDTSLFVASAANQVLAHIVVFFQPVTSGGCNDLEKKEESEGRTRACIKEPVAMDTDIEHLALTMRTSPGYTAVTMAISEHLKESLVPKENGGLHQSLQSLKLLALLLAQARPPLRDMLLRTVSGSLEALVKTGRSQHTLPLMDVLLAANSCSNTDEHLPDQRVRGLLSSMLDTHKPSDLIHAAAAVLRRGHRDVVHTSKAVGILLLPLDITTGQTLLSTDTTAEQQRFPVAELLQSKTSCISTLCVCLTNTPQITLLPPDFLPCPPVLVVTTVLSLLSICGGHAPSSIDSSKACRNIIGCGKIQKCGLEALTALSTCPGAKDKMSEVFTVLIQYLHNPDSDPTVLQKSYQALVKWMGVCTDLSSMGDQVREDLLGVVKKRVCDMRWEVRDSTVEFLGRLAGLRVCPESAQEVSVSEALLGCSTTPLLVEALCDQESYVRASATSALAQTLARSWQQGAALTQEQTDIVSRLLDILSEDTEGFARRAVVQYFTTWFSSWSSNSPPSSSPTSSPLLMKCVCSVLSQGSSDLDWEVKVHTLQLAELLLDRALPGHRVTPTPSVTYLPHPYAVGSDQAYVPHTHTDQANGARDGGGVKSDQAGVLSSLVEQGVVSALLSGLVDCDRPVALNACRLLITLRDTICPLDTTAARVPCELQGRGWGREIRKVLEKKCNWRREVTDAAPNRWERMQRLDRPGEVDSEGGDVGREEGLGGGDDSVYVSVCEVLRCLGLDERLSVLTQSSDHVQNSPLSLLQDILTASDAHTHAHMQPGQEVIVDCY